MNVIYLIINKKETLTVNLLTVRESPDCQSASSQASERLQTRSEEIFGKS